jgi:hypothetical protein
MIEFGCLGETFVQELCGLPREWLEEVCCAVAEAVAADARLFTWMMQLDSPQAIKYYAVLQRSALRYLRACLDHPTRGGRALRKALVAHLQATAIPSFTQ